MLQKNLYDLFLVTESWLGAKISDSFILEDTHYSILRADRCKKRGGGVMAIISNSLPYIEISTPKNEFFDILCFDIISPSSFEKHRFILIYL